MDAPTMIALAQGAGGALAILVVLFIMFVRGDIVSRWVYDQQVKANERLEQKNERLTELLDQAISGTDRTVSTLEKTLPRGRG